MSEKVTFNSSVKKNRSDLLKVEQDPPIAFLIEMLDYVKKNLVGDRLNDKDVKFNATKFDLNYFPKKTMVTKLTMADQGSDVGMRSQSPRRAPRL